VKACQAGRGRAERQTCDCCLECSHEPRERRRDPAMCRVRQGLASGRGGSLAGVVTCDEPPELAFYCPECAERVRRSSRVPSREDGSSKPSAGTFYCEFLSSAAADARLPPARDFDRDRGRPLVHRGGLRLTLPEQTTSTVRVRPPPAAKHVTCPRCSWTNYPLARTEPTITATTAWVVSERCAGCGAKLPKREPAAA
jgi:hypothetical protein